MIAAIKRLFIELSLIIRVTYWTYRTRSFLDRTGRDNLSSCPFCGSNQTISIVNGSIQVRCNWCGATGPRSHTKAGAALGWNGRPNDRD